jgi:ABC-type sugar transport system substrate-binding protein
LHGWCRAGSRCPHAPARPAPPSQPAAKAAGWDAKLCDGRLSAQGSAACIRQGISGKATGIVVVGQDCNSFQAALQEAKAAGIPVIGDGGNDCDVTGGEKLYSAVVQTLPDLTAQQWWAKLGALQADWIIGKTGGNAGVLSLQYTDAIWAAGSRPASRGTRHMWPLQGGQHAEGRQRRRRVRTAAAKVPHRTAEGPHRRVQRGVGRLGRHRLPRSRARQPARLTLAGAQDWVEPVFNGAALAVAVGLSS